MGWPYSKSSTKKRQSTKKCCEKLTDKVDEILYRVTENEGMLDDIWDKMFDSPQASIDKELKGRINWKITI